MQRWWSLGNRETLPKGPGQDATSFDQRGRKLWSHPGGTAWCCSSSQFQMAGIPPTLGPARRLLCKCRSDLEVYDCKFEFGTNPELSCKGLVIESTSARLLQSLKQTDKQKLSLNYSFSLWEVSMFRYYIQGWYPCFVRWINCSKRYNGPQAGGLVLFLTVTFLFLPPGVPGYQNRDNKPLQLSFSPPFFFFFFCPSKEAIVSPFFSAVHARYTGVRKGTDHDVQPHHYIGWDGDCPSCNHAKR